MEHNPVDVQADRAGDAYRVLLDAYKGSTFYVSDKKTEKALNEAVKELNKSRLQDERLPADPFKSVKNHQIGIGGTDPKLVRVPEDTLHALLAASDEKNRKLQDGSKALMACFSGPPMKLDRAAISDALTGRYMPAHDLDHSAQQILGSPLLHGRTEAGGGKSPKENLQDLSHANLERLRQEKESYRKDPELKGYVHLVDAFMQEVGKRYDGAKAVHATNNAIDGCISCTNDRKQFDELSVSLSGTKTASSKLSHTSATNTSQLETHDFVFFNIYPQVDSSRCERELLVSTRYLREKPEIKDSPFAKDACSFTFAADTLTGRDDKLAIVALRDPVYPSGGTTPLDVEKRMSHEGVATCTNGNPDVGTAHRRLGALPDVYRTHENLFVGADIKPALVENVERGLLKTFKGLHLQDGEQRREDGGAYAFYRRLHDVVGMQDGYEKDKAILGVVKLYQYPQLLVTGSVPVRDAEVFKPVTQRTEDAPAQTPQTGGQAQGDGSQQRHAQRH